MLERGNISISGLISYEVDAITLTCNIKEKNMDAKLKVPTFDELMWPALVAMKELGGSATHEELLEKVIDLEHIPEAVQNVLHTARHTKLSYNLAWAKL
jgi:hypothetical protein